MQKHSLRCSLAICTLIISSAVIAQTQNSGGSPAVSADADATITALAEDPQSDSINGKESHIGLNKRLWVVMDRPIEGNAAAYALLFNDQEIKGLEGPIASTYRSRPALVFTLKRSASNDAFWKELLGSPRHDHVDVTVSLKHPPDAAGHSRISGTSAASAFKFQVFTAVDLAMAAGVILVVLMLVWGTARYQTTLRDNLLPQLEPSCQPFSLGRSQMAFWFTIIFSSFILLFFLLQDTNTLTSQALLLMGISSVTAAAAVAVDVAKNSPAVDANRALRALGINTYPDVQRIQGEIVDRERQFDALGPSPTVDPNRRMQLQIEINDRNSILRAYTEKIRPFVSQGWFQDVTTDLNGPTVHRLQVLIWTGTLGVIFLHTVYHDLAMPVFNGILLTLMGISSAGYVGFKVQEVNN